MGQECTERWGLEATSRLAELAVTEDNLLDAIDFGLRHSFECTRLEPPSLPGVIAWGKTVRGLREKLVPKGWEPTNSRNYALVVHPSGSHAIAVACGDSNTGRVGVGIVPSTKVPKGPATKDAVRKNQLGFADIDPSFPRPLTPVTAPGAQTWILLFYLDEAAEEIKAELSLPAAITEGGSFCEWRERLILRSRPFAQGMPVTRRDMPSEGEDEPAIDIPVQRRA